VANYMSEGQVNINEQCDRKVALSLEAAAHADVALEWDDSFARDSLRSDENEVLAPSGYDPVEIAIQNEEKEIARSLEQIRESLKSEGVIER